MCQKSKSAAFFRETLVFKHIDNITFALLAITLISTSFCGTGTIGFFAILSILCTVFKLLVKPSERLELSKLDMAVVIFFMASIISLFGSSLFLASFKGFLKSVIYIAFYFCAFHFLNSNRGKINPLLALIAILVTVQGVIGIIQNFLGIEPISGWQDISNLDVQEVISRCYGTLKPYNPNLLAGYILAGISSVFYFCTINFTDKKYKRALVFLGALFACFLAVIYSGCRGGYLALFAFVAAAFVWLYFYIRETIGFENIKKRYKNFAVVISAGVLLFILSSPAISKRIMSIFVMHEDSSIGFRLNVYEACWRMFLDNFFVGIGLGNQNFREIYGLYMKTTFDALGAYSVPLEIAVETGIIGLLAFCYFIFLAFKYALHFVKNADTLRCKILALSIFLMLTSTMVHGLWDTIWYRPQVQIIFWLNIAMLNTLIMRPKLTLKKGL